MLPEYDAFQNNLLKTCHCPPSSVHRESCQAVKSVFCFTQLAELHATKLNENLQYSKGLLNVPDCATLPSKTDTSVTCVESDHHDFAAVKVRGLFCMFTWCRIKRAELLMQKVVQLSEPRSISVLDGAFWKQAHVILQSG